MKLYLKGILGLSVSAFLIWFVLRDVDPVEVARRISQGNPWWFLASVFVGTSGYLIRAMRWRIFLHPLHPATTLRSRFAGITVGFMVNNLLPARVGEFARAFALSRVEPVSASGAFGTLVVERFLDAFTLIALLFLATLAPGFPDSTELFAGSIGIMLKGTFWAFGALLVVMGFLLVLPQPTVRLAERMAVRLPGEMGPKIVAGLESFLVAMEALRNPRLLTQGVLWSFFFWSWHAFSFWLGFKAFGVEAGFAAAVFTMAMVGFAVALPAAPGFFGTFQVGVTLALTGVYGIAETPMLAFAFGYHLGGFFPVTFIGLYYAYKMQFSLKDLSSGRTVDSAPPPVEGQPQVSDP